MACCTGCGFIGYGAEMDAHRCPIDWEGYFFVMGIFILALILIVYYGG